jgi:peptidyl-prolyl cis-trans isomerase A (cyclophilin A)
MPVASNGCWSSVLARPWVRVAALFVLAMLFGPGMPVAAQGQATVRIATTLGDILVAVDLAHAPVTAANFLRYVDQGFYDGGTFHRTVTPANQPDSPVKIEVIQAGIDPARQSGEFPAIALERTQTTGLRHLAGVISMARGGPDTATSDFFICVTDQPELDFGGTRNPDGQGFAAFGRVLKGMDVVRRIQHAPASGQTLDPPVGIASIRRER